MNRVSSQLTIVLRIVIPTVWFTAILSTIVLLTWAVRGRAGLFSNPYIWLGILFIVGTGYAFIHFVLWRFYRVDMDGEHLYISNYFKTFKYPYSEVITIKDPGVLRNRIYSIILKSKGSFGQKIYFLASQALWLDFKQEHPELFDLWEEE